MMAHNRQAAWAACLMILALVAGQRESVSADDQMLSAWSEFSGKADCAKLLQWLRCKARERLTGTSCSDEWNIALPPYYGRLGIFVTLKKGSRVRGCYGAFSHSVTDAGIVLSDYLTGALTRDPRYAPLDVSELGETRIIVTIATQPCAVNDIASIDLRNYGVMLQCGESSVIYVPAEIQSLSYIEQRIRGGSCQVSAFRAVTLQ